MQLAGKVALVTGAGSGIGKAAALRFAREGARVALMSRSEGPLRATVEEIEAAGGEAIAVPADVSVPDQIQPALARAAERWERLDIVFANAGINGVWAPLDDLTPEEWDRTLTVNLKGTFLTVKYALPYLKQRGGAIVVTSSVNGTRIFSGKGRTAYACSKAAQLAFVKMTAIELARQRIRINAICPGSIETSIGESTVQRNLDRIGMPVTFPEGWIPLTGKQPGSAEQVAQLVLFLVSDAASHITGTEMWIDGAESLLMG